MQHTQKMRRFANRALATLRLALRRSLRPILVVMILVTLIPFAPIKQAEAAAIPSGLPGYFGFGVAAAPDASGIGSTTGQPSWTRDSGVGWTYSYQYLAGGVNTTNSWANWGSACPSYSRNFVPCYIQTAYAQNLIPTFTYYNLLQSSGSCNSCTEVPRVLSNLSNASVMSAYYANFTSLMQQIASTGKKVIVHIEPDLSGFVQQTNPNPAAVAAAVVNTGNTDLQGVGLTNDFAGFSRALLRLRDRYAPGNAIMAYHFSTWATGPDIAADTRASLDINGIGQLVGDFANASGVGPNPSGISSYDLLFHDVADQDAGVNNKWWDRLNVTFPNFVRWEQFVKKVSDITNRKVMVWQVPLGNQYYATMNNSSRHTQDNRSEYFLGHVRELIDSGVIGVMFGPGNSLNTTYNDAVGDGVTNPTPITSSKGMSSGTITNNHPSSYPDDDGGYIRVFAKLYYQGGVVPINPSIPATNLQFYPLPQPIRLLDTRPGEAGYYRPATLLGGGSVRNMVGRGITYQGQHIPSNARALVGNATIVSSAGGNGYATLYPGGTPLPTVSNLNYTAGQVVANSFTIGLGDDGSFNAFASATTHILVDITGYYAPPASGGLYYHALPNPIRVLDTRNGASAYYHPNTPLSGGGSKNIIARNLSYQGVTIPATAKALVGNGTVVNTTGVPGGYVTLYPGGTSQPTVSNINYEAGQIIPNSFAVGLGSDGSFNIFATSGVNFLVDITGYYSNDATDGNGAGLLYNPLPSPIRLLETRAGSTGYYQTRSPLTANAVWSNVSRNLSYQGVTIPAAAEALVGNATVVNNTGAYGGYITLYPGGAARPNASNLNYVWGQIIPNSFVVGLGSNGMFNIYTDASVNFLVDINGYFARP